MSEWPLATFAAFALWQNVVIFDPIGYLSTQLTEELCVAF